MSPLPPSPGYSSLLSSILFSSSHLRSTHAPLLCVLLLHLCSDYSSIDSHADVAIGRYADLAIDTHNRPAGSCGVLLTRQQSDEVSLVLVRK